MIGITREGSPVSLLLGVEHAMGFDPQPVLSPSTGLMTGEIWGGGFESPFRMHHNLNYVLYHSVLDVFIPHLHLVEL